MTHAERLRSAAEKDLTSHRGCACEHCESTRAACLAGAKALEIYPHDGFWSVEVREGRVTAVIKLVQEPR